MVVGRVGVLVMSLPVFSFACIGLAEFRPRYCLSQATRSLAKRAI